jgi:hypothetical protein
VEKLDLQAETPKDYFTEISNPIDEETAKMLKKIYKAVNEFHSKKQVEEITTIKILKTFAF